MPRSLIALAMLALMAPGPATALVEPETGVEYPDSLVVVTPQGRTTLVVTGAGLRERTLLQADVYTVVSYVPARADLEPAPAAAILALDAPKRLQMDMRRNVSRGKLEGTITRVMAANVDDLAPLAADLKTFFGYFPGDARKSDRIVFDYVPGVGLTTSLNGEVRGVITDFAFVTALWSVWFGRKPEDAGLTRALVSQVESR
jgi:hypothetical protein